MPSRTSRRGGIVLDLFGGSGSTLIAAHKTGRHARLCELDPVYCDRILRRWEIFAKDDAERIACGLSSQWMFDHTMRDALADRNTAGEAAADADLPERTLPMGDPARDDGQPIEAGANQSSNGFVALAPPVL